MNHTGDLSPAPYIAEGGKKATKAKKAKRPASANKPLSEYNLFVRACSKTQEGKTRSGTDMMTYCAAEWRKHKAKKAKK